LKQCLGIAPLLAISNRSPVHFDGRATFGVCGWLAMPNIHQIFGDRRVKLPRFMCEIGRWLSPLETRMLWACYWRKRRSSSAADRVLGNSVGAIELIACSDGALCTVEVGDWGCFGDLLPDTLRPFGGMAFALRRFGVGLLSG
jgi:hypothetical protein